MRLQFFQDLVVYGWCLGIFLAVVVVSHAAIYVCDHCTWNAEEITVSIHFVLNQMNVMCFHFELIPFLFVVKIVFHYLSLI